MGHSWKRFRLLALAAALLALGAAAPARAQETDAARLEADLQKARAEMAQARKDIRKAEGELRKADSLMREEGARAARAEGRQGRDREKREKENAALQARVAETQGKINAQRAAMARGQNAVDEVKARQKQLATALAAWCDSALARVEAGPPWEQAARAERLRSLKKDLEAGSAAPEEGFARLSAVLKEEIKLGDEVSLLNKPVTRLNGEVVNAQVLRFGNQWLAYMDEEGRHFGVLERQGGGWKWREDLGFAEKNRIRSALEVKAAKRPPQLVLLDLGVSLPGGAGADAEGGAK